MRGGARLAGRYRFFLFINSQVHELQHCYSVQVYDRIRITVDMCINECNDGSIRKQLIDFMVHKLDPVLTLPFVFQPV